MVKVCECGVPYVEHIRCVECWLLLHIDEKYCHIYNSPVLIGFTVNGIRCFECVPGSNKNPAANLPQKRGRKPLTEEERKERQLFLDRIRNNSEERKKYNRDRRRKRYQTDPVYREKIRARSRENIRKLNGSFIDNEVK